MEKVFVYELLDRLGEQFYVGVTSNPDRRLEMHKRESFFTQKDYTMRVLFTCPTRERALLMEKILHKGGAGKRCTVGKAKKDWRNTWRMR